jgi:hypothetical protein
MKLPLWAMDAVGQKIKTAAATTNPAYNFFISNLLVLKHRIFHLPAL